MPESNDIRLIFVGQASLCRAVSEYMEHYHAERNHQGLENRLIDAPVDSGEAGPVFRPMPGQHSDSCRAGGVTRDAHCQ
jgi:hypothetical protein